MRVSRHWDLVNWNLIEIFWDISKTPPRGEAEMDVGYRSSALSGGNLTDLSIFTLSGRTCIEGAEWQG